MSDVSSYSAVGPAGQIPKQTFAPRRIAPSDTVLGHLVVHEGSEEMRDSLAAIADLGDITYAVTAIRRATVPDLAVEDHNTSGVASARCHQ